MMFPGVLDHPKEKLLPDEVRMALRIIGFGIVCFLMHNYGSLLDMPETIKMA